MSYYIYFRFDGIVKEEHRSAFAEAIKHKCWSYLDVHLDAFDSEYDDDLYYSGFFGQFDEQIGRFKIDSCINTTRHPISMLTDFEMNFNRFFDKLYKMEYTEDEVGGYSLTDMKMPKKFRTVTLPFSDTDNDSDYYECCANMPFCDNIDDYERLLNK